MKTLFEELTEWRTRLACTHVAAGLPLCNSTIVELDALLARHRESERWHYPAEGEVPPEWTEVVGECRGLWRAARRNSQGWIRADGEPSRFVPTRWRYLSPADVPETP